MGISNEEKVTALKYVFQKSIEEFGKFFLKNHLRKKTPKFHKEIFKIYQSEKKRIVIGAPRGHAKTTITDLVFLLWIIINRKAHFILLVSDTYSQATLFLDAIKAEIETNDQLKAFYKIKQGNWSEGEIEVNGIMIKAVGAGMKVRGLKYRQYRPDLIIVDDLENDELVESKDRREKLERWFNGALVPSLSKNGRLIVIGTILHFDSLLAKLLGEEKYNEYYKKTYRAVTNNKPLWKEHLNLRELEKIKEEYIANGQGYLYYSEYQNDPTTEEFRKFKLSKFNYYDKLEGKNLNTVLLIDRAYSTAKTADFTGMVVVSADKENNWYVREALRVKGEEREVINAIFTLYEQYHPTKVGIEQKAFTYTLEPTLKDEMRKRNHFFITTELKDGGNNKELRIEGLLPRFESGSIFFKKEQTDIIDEMITFPKGVHDDLLDALAYAPNLLTEPKRKRKIVRRKIKNEIIGI